MFIATIVGLYTTRVVLQTLGVSDYGIFGVVGSITAMLSFLKISLSNSTTRFLSYEIGCGDAQRLSLTFSTSMIIHIAMAVVIVVLAETIGLWFLENKLVIPEGRMDAARLVLHCSVISSAITITQVPYNSSIIAHEKMNVYAYVEILYVVLKLVIVYLLVIGNFDKLKLYSSLLLVVTIIISLIYFIYCRRQFKETSFSWVWNKTMMKDITNFSLWQMFSSLCMTLKQQGQNFIVNIYRGVTLNASLGISDMVYGTLTSLSYNMLAAFNPSIIKSYAAKDYQQMTSLVSNASMLAFLLLAFVSVPFIINMEAILSLWLGEIPPYVCEICTIALIMNCFGAFNSVLSTAVNATGKNKSISIIIGFSMLFGLIVLCGTFICDLPIIYSFVAFYLGVPVMLLGCIVEVKRKIPFLPMRKIIGQGILKPTIISCAVFMVVYYSQTMFAEGFVRILMTSLISSCLFAALVFTLCLTDQQRSLVRNKVKSIIIK